MYFIFWVVQVGIDFYILGAMTPYLTVSEFISILLVLVFGSIAVIRQA